MLHARMGPQQVGVGSAGREWSWACLVSWWPCPADRPVGPVGARGTGAARNLPCCLLMLTSFAAAPKRMLLL